MHCNQKACEVTHSSTATLLDLGLLGLPVTDDRADGLGDVVDVGGGEAAHVDAAGLHHIDVELLHQLFTLLLCNIQAIHNVTAS